MLLALTIAGFLGALLTLLMTLANLRVYMAPPAGDPADGTLVSVCIPARNEESNLEACVRSLLASGHRAIEILVYDDESTDATPDILARIAAEDARVRVVPTSPLPPGWNGKQHACARMGEDARGEWVLFTDADVRFEADAVGAALAFARASGADLVSTFPRQIVRTPGELLLVPMIFFILLSYLPFGRMRSTNDPGAVAGCGQFVFARTRSYRQVGGHAVCRDSMHDGIKLPRAFRRAGFRTDLFDGTALSSVRMYRGLGESWRGFAKNAYEGLGSVGLLVFLTVFHAATHLAPWVLLPALWIGDGPAWPVALCAGAVGCAAVQRGLLARRFGHPILLAALHPLTIAMMTGVQWHSFAKHTRGTRTWRGRSLNGAGAGGAGGGERVVLVDEADRELGTMDKIEAHRDGGRLHRAFSVFLFDGEGRLLLQRRAKSKYHFGGLWTNTCCSHPRAGEAVLDAGRRRLREELGVDAPLEAVGSFIYTAHDESTGLTEHELDHILIGRFEGEPRPDRAEVAGWRWISPEQLDEEIGSSPGSFTPWFPLAWRRLREMMPAPAI
jgi:isopentenyl-diphosphate delta-isomerase type 1